MPVLAATLRKDLCLTGNPIIGDTWSCCMKISLVSLCSPRGMAISLLYGIPLLALGLLVSPTTAEDAPTGTTKKAADLTGEADGLLGYWKLRGDAKDSSGNGLDGVNHGVNLETGEFDGKGAYVEILHSKALVLGQGDFSLSAWVWTSEEVNDVIGDVLTKFDPVKRRGFTLTINSSAGGYQAHGSDKHLLFGMDDGKDPVWEDHGHPNPKSNHASNTVVYRGHLYAAYFGSKSPEEGVHIYRFDGGKKWTHCGTVGDASTAGAGAMIVHKDELYVGTGTYDWTRVKDDEYGYGPSHVYRYLGDSNWEDCGTVGDNRRINSMASFRGRLYAGAGNELSGLFVYEGGQKWALVKEMDTIGSKPLFPHAMCVHDGVLYISCHPGYVITYDGKDWGFAGKPTEGNQVHDLEVHRGQLYAGTWPAGEIARYLGGEKWENCGDPGEDGTEVQSLITYNGKFYAGFIPRAEVSRFEERGKWTSLRRFYSPDGWTPVPVNTKGGDHKIPGYLDARLEWTRVTSMNSYQGRVFATIGSCTSSVLDAPIDVRGSVQSMEVGRCVSYDQDLGAGWHHLAAVRSGDQLHLYIDGKAAGSSKKFEAAEYDLSNEQSLLIGFGETDYFSGKIREVRLYGRALSGKEIEVLDHGGSWGLE